MDRNTIVHMFKFMFVLISHNLLCKIPAILKDFY